MSFSKSFPWYAFTLVDHPWTNSSSEVNKHTALEDLCSPGQEPSVPRWSLSPVPALASLCSLSLAAFAWTREKEKNEKDKRLTWLTQGYHHQYHRYHQCSRQAVWHRPRIRSNVYQESFSDRTFMVSSLPERAFLWGSSAMSDKELCRRGWLAKKSLARWKGRKVWKRDTCIPSWMHVTATVSAQRSELQTTNSQLRRFCLPKNQTKTKTRTE